MSSVTRRRKRDATNSRGAGNTVSQYRVPVGSVVVKPDGKKFVVIEDLSYVGPNRRGEVNGEQAVRAAPIIGETVYWRSSVYLDGVIKVTGETRDVSEHLARTEKEAGEEELPVYNLRLGD